MHASPANKYKGMPSPLDEEAPGQPIVITVKLMNGRFLMFVAGASAFFIAFAVGFFYGFQVRDDVFDDVGSSEKSENMISKVNSASGFIMEMFQVAIGMILARFYPVFEVCFHNVFFPNGTEGPPAHVQVPAEQQHQPTGWSSRWRGVAAWFTPFLIMMAIQNSFKSFQASTKTVGFLHIVSSEDLVFEETTAPKIGHVNVSSLSSTKVNEHSVRNTILKNAIEQKTTPFIYKTTSKCSQTPSGNQTDGGVSNSVVQVDTVDATSVVYGFVSNEWNYEALPEELDPINTFNVTAANVANAIAPKWVDMDLQFDLFLHLKVMVERSYMETSTVPYPCVYSLSTNYSETTVDQIRRDARAALPANNSSPSTSNRTTRRRLNDDDFLINDDVSSSGSGMDLDDAGLPANGLRFGGMSSLRNYAADYADKKRHTLPVLLEHIAKGIDKSLTDVDTLHSIEQAGLNFSLHSALQTEETTVTFEQYQLSGSIRVDALRVDTVMQLLGTKSECVTLGADANPPCNSSVISYGLFSNDMCGADGCMFLDDSVLRKQVLVMPFMKNCNPANATYNRHHRMFSMDNSCQAANNSMIVYGLGSYVSAKEMGNNWRGKSAYLAFPKRHYRFSVARVTWEPEPLDKKFDLECKAANGDCTGLAFKLRGSRRMLLAGKDALNMDRLQQARFERPISLVQLNEAELSLGDVWSGNIEKINPKYIAKSTWTPLNGSRCSRLMDSFADQVDKNAYYLEKPLQVMYTSALFFLFEKASVTGFNATRSGLQVTSLSLEESGQSALKHLKLKGDKQVRSLRLRVPDENRIGAVVGTAFMLIIVAVIVSQHTDPLRAWERESHVTEYLAMQDDDAYGDRIHSKTFRNLPDASHSHEMEAFQVTEITLREAKAEEPRRIQL